MLQLYLKNKNKFAQMIGEDVFIDPSLDYTEDIYYGNDRFCKSWVM